MEAFANLLVRNKSVQSIGKIIKATISWINAPSQEESVLFSRRATTVPIRTQVRNGNIVEAKHALEQLQLFPSRGFHQQCTQAVGSHHLRNLVRDIFVKGDLSQYDRESAQFDKSVVGTMLVSKPVNMFSPCSVLGGMSIQLFTTLFGEPPIYQSVNPAGDSPLGAILDRTAELAREHQDLEDEYNTLVVFIEMQKDKISELKDQVRRLRHGQGGMASLLLSN